MNRRAVLLFVKYPEPGRVKTRLAATLGAERAAEIYRRLVGEVFLRLPAEVEIIAMFDPPERRAEIELWLAGLAEGRALSFSPQSEGDLGRRLEHAFAEAFAAGWQAVAGIGTDCVEIDAATFEQTWAGLAKADIVLGPSEDGGYYLIGLRQPSAPLFTGIDWSTDRVLAQTLARAVEAGQSVRLLPKCADVDTEDDWRRAEARLDP